MKKAAHSSTQTLPVLVAALDTAFTGQSWHGPTLLGSLRGVPASLAAQTPPKLKHSIWQLALHAAYWKYIVLRQLSAKPVPPFPRSPSNWPRIPAQPDAPAWKRDLALLKSMHADLRAALIDIDPECLDQIPPSGRRWTYAFLIRGVTAHDLYHAGQIQLIKRLLTRR